MQRLLLWLLFAVGMLVTAFPESWALLLPLAVLIAVGLTT